MKALIFSVDAYVKYYIKQKKNIRKPTFIEFVISLQYRRNNRNNGEEQMMGTDSNWLNRYTVTALPEL